MRMHLLGTAASDSFNDRLHDVAATAPGRAPALISFPIAVIRSFPSGCLGR